MIKEYYECPDCYEQRVVVERINDTEIYRCENCGHYYEKQEWDDMHNYLHDVLDEHYDEEERGEVWDKED